MSFWSALGGLGGLLGGGALLATGNPLGATLMGAGLGLGKSALSDEPQEERDRQLASETQRYSPWTGLKAGAIRRADPFGSGLQGGVTGTMVGQNLAQTGLLNGLKGWTMPQALPGANMGVAGNLHPGSMNPLQDNLALQGGSPFAKAAAWGKLRQYPPGMEF